MPAIHVFIDTNVFLNFYSFPDDSSTALDELLEHMGPDKINVHLPKQVEDEFERNRESKLQAAVGDFRNAKMPTAIPNHMRGAETAKQYDEALKNAEHAKKSLIANVIGLSFQRELEVDTQIEKVFSASTRHDDCDAALASAIARMHKGNPPGKPGNVGDRYNWEILLAKVPDQDLFIVTKDGDFTSPLGSLDKSMRPMSFLAREWAAKSNGRSVYIHSSIRSIVDHFKMLEAQPENVAPADDVVAPAPIPVDPPNPPGQAQMPQLVEEDPAQEAKDKAIEALCSSESFAQTHRAVERLLKMRSLLTPADAERLFNAALENQQIRWIISDTDVNSFFVKVLNDHFAEAEAGIVESMIGLLGLDQAEGSDSESDG
jgi:rRNA-processing protein FCF1